LIPKLKVAETKEVPVQKQIVKILNKIGVLINIIDLFCFYYIYFIKERSHEYKKVKANPIIAIFLISEDLSN
jgi:hypothetical protein